MPTLQLLNEFQRKSFDAAPKLNDKQRIQYFAISDEIWVYINNMRDTINQVVFLIQLAYFRASGKFFINDAFRWIDIKYTCDVLEIDSVDMLEDIKSYSSKCRNIHKNYILEYSGWQKYTNKCSEVNLKLIDSNWDDMLRLIATIKTKTVTASQIFSRLNSYTKEPSLYKALKEFGIIYIFHKYWFISMRRIKNYYLKP